MMLRKSKSILMFCIVVHVCIAEIHGYDIISALSRVYVWSYVIFLLQKVQINVKGIYN